MGTKKAIITGTPEHEHISTSLIERQDLTMRMSMRRFTGLTNTFSKKVENHERMVALHYMFYNFACIYQSLRVTPAVNADHVWSLEEVVALMGYEPYFRRVPFPATSVANCFLALAANDGRELTNMQLQKLVFISHGFYMAMNDGERLVDETAKAWQWGPVFPKLYKRFMVYGSSPIAAPAPGVPPIEENSPAHALIRQVWQSYGKFSGAQLSAITHQPDSPWSVTWEKKEFGVIDDGFIAEHYAQLLAANAG